MMLKRCFVVFLALCSCLVSAESLVRSAYPLLDNRFRVDHGLDEITLVIYRKMGTAPAIIVQPDGSKLYVHTSPPNVAWIDESNFDIITIAAPMAGPWQVIGNIDKRNQIKILSDLQLEVDPFPDTFFSGERLKVRANLVNLGDKLSIEAFRLNTQLRLFMHRRGIRLTNIDSIAAGIELGRFYDEGTGLDEFPGDGDFTAEVTTSVSPGRYQFFVMAQNKTFTRMKMQDVKILANPISAELINENGNPAFIRLTVDSEKLKPESVAMSLRVLGAAKFSRSFNVKELVDGEYMLDLASIYRTGDYRLEGWLYATTHSGREVAIEVDPIIFGLIRESSISTSELTTTSDARSQITSSYARKSGNEAKTQGSQTESKEESGSLLWVWITLAAIILLAAVGAAVWWFVIRPKRANAEKSEETEDKKVDLNKPEG